MSWADITKSKLESDKWEVMAASTWSGTFDTEIEATMKAIELLNNGIKEMQVRKIELKDDVLRLLEVL